MRKFIIKNRQKRKYIRRNSSASSFSFPDLMLIGLIPSILIASAYLTTNMHRLDNISLSYPQIDITFNLPGAMYTVSALTNEINAQLSLFFLRTSSILTATWSIFISFIATQSSQVVNVVLHGVGSGNSLLSGVGEWMQSQSTSISKMIHAIVQDATAWIASVFSQIAKSVVYLTGELVAKISSSTAVFFKYVTLPFKVIGGYLMKLYPFYDYLRIAFTDAALELDVGLRNVLNIATSISKTSVTN